MLFVFLLYMFIALDPTIDHRITYNDLEVTLTCMLMQDQYLEHLEISSVSCILYYVCLLFSFTIFDSTDGILLLLLCITRWGNRDYHLCSKIINLKIGRAHV